MSILTKIKKKLAHYTWDLAYGEYTDDIIEIGRASCRERVSNNV